MNRFAAGGTIVLAPHSAEWAAAFEHEAAALANAMAGVPFEIHHIGSTAIPGIVAKPVIDMLAVVPDVALLDEHAHRIVALGYEAMGEFGIEGRRYFRKDAPDGTRTHQLHGFAAGSRDAQRHLDFRDYLRTFPPYAAAYETLKKDLAARCGSDMKAYSEGKSDFVRDVERRAADWRSR